jgi:hypothetical protein
MVGCIVERETTVALRGLRTRIEYGRVGKGGRRVRRPSEVCVCVSVPACVAMVGGSRLTEAVPAYAPNNPRGSAFSCDGRAHTHSLSWPPPAPRHDARRLRC